jgi:putative ABC transport system substrate-binding protein
MTRDQRPSWSQRLSVVVALAALMTAGTAAGAGPVRIGVLSESWGPPAATFGLRDRLKELGYREHTDFVIGTRFTQGDPTALSAAARELIALGVDILFVEELNAAKALAEATKKIPIVLGGVGNLVEEGLIASFARPGGNVTGVTELDLELAPKRLEVFRDLVPGLKRILFAYRAGDQHAAREAAFYRDAGRKLGIRLVEKPLQSMDDARTALAQIRKGDVDGALAPYHASLNIPGFLLDAARRNAIPTMFAAAFWVKEGGLVSYGPDYYETGRDAGRLVDKILKGANPGTIPIEVNRKVRMTINLKVARALGLSIPPAILARTDELVE